MTTADAQPPAVDPEVEALWREVLLHGNAGRWAFLPADPRCMVCHQPFQGVGGRLLRMFRNYGPATMSPNICNYCEDHLPPGGAEVDVAVLFADLRGSTELGSSMGPVEFATLLNRFYEETSDVLVAAQSWIDKLVGDEVMALYVPAMGDAYRGNAINAGIRLLQALGYRPGGEPWLEVGVGVNAGPAFVGKVGRTGSQQVTALGDTVNTAARIQAQARPGELLLGAELYRPFADAYPDAESRVLELKGKEQPVHVYVIRPALLELPGRSHA